MAEEKELIATRISLLRRQLIEALVRLEYIERIFRQETGDEFFEENSELLEKVRR